MTNIEHIICDKDTWLNHSSLRDYKEVWSLRMSDNNFSGGSIVAAINLEDEFLVYDEYKIKILKIRRKEKLNKINGI